MPKRSRHGSLVTSAMWGTKSKSIFAQGMFSKPGFDIEQVFEKKAL
jgi:hypothetical protein